MKLRTPGHPNTKKLARLLSVNIYTAVGILECIRQFAEIYTPNGDIGKYENELITEGSYWDGDADFLINALIESGWLLECNGPSRLELSEWLADGDGEEV